MPVINLLGNRKRWLLLVPLLLVSACSTSDLEIWRQIPIQMARVSQTEKFSLKFRISTPAIARMETRQRNIALDQRMDLIFINLIGAKNWQLIKNLYGVSAVRDELLSGEIHMEGLFNFHLYLDPLDLDKVVLEGSGRYFAIRDNTEAILISGDFHVAPQRYPIATITAGCLPLDNQLYIARIPGKTTYHKNILVRHDLIIDTSNADDKAFSIDYAKQHPAYLDLDGDGTYDPVIERIGDLTIDDLNHQVKLFDIRGLLFIKKNYQISSKARIAASDSASEQRQCVQSAAAATTKPQE